MLLIRHPRRKLAVAALAIGFWSQVYLWHGWIHDPGDDHLALDAPPRPGPAPDDAELEPFVRLGPPTYPCTGGPREERPSRRTYNFDEAAVMEAVRSATPRIMAHAAYLPVSARLDVRLSVMPGGWLSKVEIEAEPGELSRRGRRAIERALEGTSFPSYAESYVAEFPLIIQRTP